MIQCFVFESCVHIYSVTPSEARDLDPLGLLSVSQLWAETGFLLPHGGSLVLLCGYSEGLGEAVDFGGDVVEGAAEG